MHGNCVLVHVMTCTLSCTVHENDASVVANDGEDASVFANDGDNASVFANDGEDAFRGRSLRRWPSPRRRLRRSQGIRRASAKFQLARELIV